MSVSSDKRAEWPGRQKLRLALGVSLVLHLGGLATLQRVFGSAPGVAAALAAEGAAMNAVLLGPHRPGKAAPQPATGAPAGQETDELTPASAASAASIAAAAESGTMASGSKARLPTERVNESSVPPASAERLAALGQRLLAAYVPPYLAQPFAPERSAGPWYFRRAELSVGAMPLDEPSIEPPADGASNAPRAGKVVLRVFLAADGAVEGIEVASSSLPAAYGDAAVAAFSRLRFRPGEIEGVAVSSESRFEVAFDAFESGSSHATDRGAGRELLRGLAGAGEKSPDESGSYQKNVSPADVGARSIGR